MGRKQSIFEERVNISIRKGGLLVLNGAKSLFSKREKKQLSHNETILFMARHIDELERKLHEVNDIR